MNRTVAAATLALALLGTGCDPSSESIADGVTTSQRPVDTKWKCHQCGEWHTDLPFAYGPARPDPYFSIPEDERESRTEVDKDFCVIDGEDFFVRGRLEIAVVDANETFVWNVWVSLSEANFNRTIELLDTQGRESEESYFGWLCTNLGVYPDTTHLKTRVHTQPVGHLPTIELEPTDHPLAVEQRTGITLDRVKEIASLILHRDASSEKER